MKWKNINHLLSVAAICCLLACGQAAAQTLSAWFHPPLRGLRIVVDPGHGGVDDGTQIAGQHKEKAVNLQLALALRDVLRSMGAEVVMTRETDRELSRFSRVYNGRHREDLAKRVQIIEESGCDFWVSLHCNSAPGHPGARGPIVYFSGASPAGAALAKTVQSRLNRMNLAPFSASQRPHTALAADYYLLHNSNVPGVLVEAGYLSNSLDLSLLLNSRWQRAFANSLALGIADHLNAPPAATAQGASRQMLFLLPVDETRPAAWSELLASPLPLTFLLDGQADGWQALAERIHQAGHDVLVRAQANADSTLVSGLYLESAAAVVETPTATIIRAPALQATADHQVTAVITAGSPQQFCGRLLQILQASQGQRQIVLLDCPDANLRQLLSALPQVLNLLEAEQVQPMFCGDLPS